MRKKNIIVGLVFFSFMCAHQLHAEQTMLSDYNDLTLEDLLNMQVTTAAGRQQQLLQVPQSMNVITREDIERSGARQIQELFYRVPGMNVRQTDGHLYGVSIRNDGSLLTDNLLILIDGIIVFNPGFGGTIWHSLPVSMDEIERIEIIRGAGGVLYSANAVAGVINIITRSAKDQDKYVAARTGSQYYASTSTGMGVKPFDDIDFYTRGYFEFDRDDGFRKRGAIGNQNDDIKRYNFGFRSEYDFSEDMQLSVLMKHNSNELVDLGILAATSPYKQMGQMTQTAARFYHRLSDSYEYEVDWWYNYHMNSMFSTDDANIHATSIKTQHNVYGDILGEHVFSFGGEILLNYVDVDESIFRDAENSQRIASIFVQEEYKPVKQVIATGGIRVDANTNIKDHKLAWQPFVSLMYAPNETHSFRVVASHMVRQNSFAERDINKSFNAGALTYIGTSDIDPEKWWTYEAGYRGLFFDSRLSFDANMFLTYIDDLTLVSNPAPFNTLAIINTDDFRLYGMECEATYNVTNYLDIFADYTYLESRSTPDPNSPSNEKTCRNIPKHMVGGGMRLTWKRLKVDCYLKLIDSTTNLSQPYELLGGTQDEKIPSVFKNMFRVAYEFNIPKSENVTSEIELVANDLFDGRRKETTRDYFIDPVVYGGIKVKF